MFVATALYKQLTTEVMGLEQNISLTNSQRLGFFPVFETKEQADKFAKDMLTAQGIEVNIIELDKVGKVLELDYEQRLNIFTYGYRKGYEDCEKERSYDPHSHDIPPLADTKPNA